MSTFTRWGGPLSLLVVLGSISGCCEWSCKKPQWLYGKDEPRTPVKVVAMWKDTILYRADQPQPVRGFGGRLMFYGEKSEKPVKVEGTLTVYAFDETHSKKEDPRPTRKYVFTAEQFALHYSKSDIGHSYSVWLPWDAASNPPCKISLIARFMPKKQGGLVVGEQCLQLLPGPEGLTPAAEPPQTSGTPRTANPVRPASAEVEVPDRLDSTAPAATLSPGLRSVTIPVPLQSRMYNSSAAAPPGANGMRPITLPATACATPGASWTTNPAGSDCPVSGPSWESPSVATNDPRFAPVSAWSRSTRYEPPKPRVQGAPLVPPRSDRVLSPLHPEEQQLNPAQSPGSASGS